jgi:aspartate-semialdehyde dehydrogenase
MSMEELLERPVDTLDEIDEQLAPVGTEATPQAVAAPPAIGIIGPGLVGTKLIKYFEDSEVADVTRVFASERSAGTAIGVGPGRSVTIELASEADYGGLDAVCNTAPAGFAAEYGERIAGQAGVLIDGSSDWRQDPDVPLLIPEINPWVVYRAHKNIIAKPNCTTTIGAFAIAALHEAAGLRSLSVTTYQSTSGQGEAGLREHYEQTAVTYQRQHELIHGQTEPYPESEVFPARTAFNVAPLAGTMLPDGHTTEEMKYKNETRKIFGLDDDVAIDVTCARVGTFNGHAVDLHAEFEGEISAFEASHLLANAEGVQLHRDDDVPQPIFAVGTEPVHVGRVRQSERFGYRGIRLFAVGDNLLVGAALNIFRGTQHVLSNR